MREMDDSNDGVSRMIRVIDEIGFQANILALNTAVEAATMIDPAEHRKQKGAVPAEQHASSVEQLATQTQSLHRLVDSVRSLVTGAFSAPTTTRHPRGNGHAANQSETDVARLPQTPADRASTVWRCSFPLDDSGREA